MSDRDVQLLTTIDMQYTDLANIVKMSRQTVSKVVNSKDDFLTAGKLAKIYDNLRTNSPNNCTLVQRAIEAIYPEYGELIFDEDTQLPNEGEFWFASPDFISFKGQYVTCTDILIQLAKGYSSNLVVFSQNHDYKSCKKFFEREENIGPNATFVVQCTQDLGLIPPLLLLNSRSDEKSLFVASPDGFKPVAQHDAPRIWSLLSDLRHEESSIQSN